MPNTQTVYLTGKAKWAKVYVPDEFNGVKRWRISLYPDPQSLDRFRKLGLKIQVRHDDDGEYINLSRPCEKIINGNVVQFEPPRVCYGPEEEDFDRQIGNGSDVTVGLSVFDTRFGKGHRLNVVRVDNLVEYDGDGPQKMPAREELVTYQNQKEILAPKKRVVEMSDEEIPF